MLGTVFGKFMTGVGTRNSKLWFRFTPFHNKIINYVPSQDKQTRMPITRLLYQSK